MHPHGIGYIACFILAILNYYVVSNVWGMDLNMMVSNSHSHTMTMGGSS